jgi:peroxiredoxin family protein
VTALGSECADVDGRLGVGREHDQRLAWRERGQRTAGLEGGERAEEPAGVEELRHTLSRMMIAAILESGRPERLYTGLSLLVSAAAEGRPARGLVSFGALGPLLDDAPPGEDTFSRSLHELRETARELEDCRLWACAAAVELTGASAEAIEAKLDGVMSTPRFLREVEGAQLVVV